MTRNRLWRSVIGPEIDRAWVGDRRGIAATCLAEVLGTFALVFFSAGAVAVDAASGGAVTGVGAGIVSGLVVVAMVYALGHVSGAHINPVVTLAFRVSRRIGTARALAYVAAQVVGFGLKNTSLLLDPTPDTSNRNLIGDQLDASTRIPRVSWFGNEFPISGFVALILAVLVALALTWTVAGFRLQMLGRGLRTAHRAGVSESRYGGLALVISGAFCGLAGAFMLAGGDFGNYRLTPGFAVNIGWGGLLVALVARTHPILAIPAAFVFAALRTGSSFLAATGVDRDITKVVQALLVLALLVPPAVLFVRDRRRALAAARDRV